MDHHQGDARRLSPRPGPQIHAVSSRPLRHPPSSEPALKRRANVDASRSGAKVHLRRPAHAKSDATPEAGVSSEPTQRSLFASQAGISAVGERALTYRVKRQQNPRLQEGAEKSLFEVFRRS